MGANIDNDDGDMNESGLLFVENTKRRDEDWTSGRNLNIRPRRKGEKQGKHPRTGKWVTVHLDRGPGGRNPHEFLLPGPKRESSCKWCSINAGH
jgi:hypothetical protein